VNMAFFALIYIRSCIVVLLLWLLYFSFSFNTSANFPSFYGIGAARTLLTDSTTPIYVRRFLVRVLSTYCMQEGLAVFSSQLHY
jgi:hypothetical protein